MANTSLSLLESQAPSQPAMSQVEGEDGAITFKCNSCDNQYKQLKRLQNHLRDKHGIQIDLDETVNNFSPTMVSTHEDAVGAADITIKVEPEKDKKLKRALQIEAGFPACCGTQ